MWVLVLTGFLLYGSIHTAHSAVSNQSGTEQGNTLLFCKHDGKVIWSKGVDGGRGDILTAENGEIIIKHKPDPDNRYSVLSDLSLLIQNLFQSDSGIYYCNAVPVVNLTVSSLNGNNTEKVTDSTLKDSASGGPPPYQTTEPPFGEGGDKMDKKAEKDGEDDDDDDDDEKELWTVAAVVGVSCVVVLLLALLMWRFFTKRKSQQNQIHMQDSINNLPAAPPPGFSVIQNQEAIYASINELPEARQCGDQERENEAVYFLATSPTSNTTGDQERENEAVYFLATSPTSNTTDQDQVGQIYAKIQKPKNNT
ncbi:uncharacterized protein LOC132875162 isoform X2 [Neoarius graeffei]|uniref:uncharacterized protein LOC132875162 isoform X2 n=1 Tax=Neoarius graeffei TaxID=443677 RepID=UPI00298C059A|nr:uncharacterized protein LOC132875162 isoform X2 [Neoarius graeffei]